MHFVQQRDPSEDIEGVLQASEPVHGEVLKKEEDPENRVRVRIILFPGCKKLEQ